MSRRDAGGCLVTEEQEPYDGEYLDLAIYALLAIPVAGVLCMAAMVFCIVFMW